MGYKQKQFSPGKELAGRIARAFEDSDYASESALIKHLVELGLDKYEAPNTDESDLVKLIDERIKLHQGGAS